MKRLATSSERDLMNIMPRKGVWDYPGFLSGVHSDFNCYLGGFDPYFLSPSLGINTPDLKASAIGEIITTSNFIVLSIKQL